MSEPSGASLPEASEPEKHFAFGRNWQHFIEHLDDERIADAERSMTTMLGNDGLEGKSFLDVGSGSGLFSLMAARLGADRIQSFDYDPDSVACTTELRRRYFGDDPRWQIEQGDATDPAYVSGLGRFDFVYSWGVLHHTGQMWRGIENASGAVAPGGRLWLALYNDRGIRSDFWRVVKRAYTKVPPLRPLIIAVYATTSFLRNGIYKLLRGRPTEVFTYWTRRGDRGMSGWHDLIDWAGGYPYEVAKPEEVIDFCAERGFRLQRLTTVNTFGNNEFLFVRDPDGSTDAN